ncbi:beta-lactamase/transpeptidase-like protein [Lophiotrema nucula]|uniref:Beta-lactamase/transpeptidase-like protein n=1 Tax=Lophiotrema nucula TaxID=690887 RepID=A0A6A5ZHT5_9PLEO|nr:beta-lactamase/transpeptidase-like protein [Lophiotrema nucula]
MTEDVTSLQERLDSQKSTIEAICKTAGVAGVSIGVLHGGEIVHTKHFGFRNVADKQQADGDTLYGIGSCSKSYFAAVAAALVEEGKLSWTAPTKTIVPEFNASSQVVKDEANMIDSAAHRLRLSGAFHLTFQGDGDHLIHTKDFWTYYTKLSSVTSLRASWIYNSHGYSVLGAQIERVSGRSLAQCLRDYVTKPLALDRTVCELDFHTTPNFAKPYAALADGTPYKLPCRQDFRGHFFEAAAGIYTSLNDTLKYASAVLEAASKLPLKADGPIRESDQLFTSHIPVVNPSFRERSYALDWIRTQLPGVVGVMGDNRRILPIDQLPVIGRGATPRLALYHQGATVGYFPSFYLFPETKSAVMVLTNSIANCDAADWIAQTMIQALFDDKDPIDWLELTRKFTRQCLQYYDDMQDEVRQKRQAGGPKRDLDAYLGDYYDNTGIFYIRIRRHPEKEDALQLEFQGLKKHAYQLRFFYDDTFEWTLSRDETAKRARYHQFDQEYFNFHFHSSDGTAMNSLTWHHDPMVTKPETFERGKSGGLA